MSSLFFNYLLCSKMTLLFLNKDMYPRPRIQETEMYKRDIFLKTTQTTIHKVTLIFHAHYVQNIDI